MEARTEYTIKGSFASGYMFHVGGLAFGVRASDKRESIIDTGLAIEENISYYIERMNKMQKSCEIPQSYLDRFGTASE